MPSESSIAWKRIFAEGAAIVISILMAFGIQAWWEETGDRTRERGALEALAADFAAADSVLQLRTLALDSAAVSAQRVMELVGPSAPLSNSDSIAEHLPRIIRRPTFEPPMGTLEALLGSGELRLIQRRELRAELASFPSEIEGMATTQDFGSEVVFGMLLPFLNERVPMLEFGLMARGDSDFVSNPEVLVRSLEFENLAQTRLMGIRFSLLSAESVGRRIDEIRTLLGEELRPK